MTYPALPRGGYVTIKHRYKTGGKDEFGNDQYAYTVSTVGPCSVQYSGSRESINFTDQVTTAIIVFVPYGTDIGYLDAITVNGIEYEVTADPESWQSPFTGRTSPMRVVGTLVKGASP